MYRMIRQVCKIEFLLFCLICVVSIFFYSHHIINSEITSKWYFTLFVGLISIIILSIKSLSGKKIQVNILTLSYVIVAACFFQALYGIAQWFNHTPSVNNYKIIGSFDNPAGFASCLSIGLPFVLICLKYIKKRLFSVAMYTLAIIIFIAVILSESRSGIISITIAISLWLNQYLQFKKTNKKVFFISIFVLLFIGAYFFKRNSADGRLLIWKCSLEMIKDSPVFGHGLGSFRANYMDYQADYFMKHPDNKYSMLADNVLCPFNEYLTVVLNFGFIGLFLLFAIGRILLFCYYKNPTFEGKVALFSLLIISIFSLFSYPFTYPFVWLVLFFNIYLLVNPFCKSVKIVYKNILCIFFSLFSLGLSYKVYQRFQAELKWHEIISYTNPFLSDYLSLENDLGKNPYFIYNYAVVLYEMNINEESLEKALLCRKYWADYELEILLGNIHKKMGKYDQAETYFKSAALMCPCRFIPIYQLYELYKDKGDKNKAYIMGELILNKPVKINSITIMQIKNRIKKELKMGKI